ncbi:TIGR02646 family protein [Myxococcota bacterium]|nr:TIGR02646 family protein [Myxococcota bacterium]
MIPDIRSQLKSDQGCLCAYCEARLIENDPHRWGVEHFVQRALTSSNHNWDLDWDNLLAVCKGGENDPKPRELHCDRQKNDGGKKPPLPPDCRGYILKPTELQALPSLFDFDLSTGALSPNVQVCQQFSPPSNQMPSTAALVQNTIDHLNLNCERLKEKRKVARQDLEERIAATRQNGKTLNGLVADVFKDPHFWPEFFTVYLIRLGNIAKNFLVQNNYTG